MKKPLLLRGLLLLCLLALFFQPAFAQIDLQITEIWSGQIGDDLTADWFEIKNVGDIPWTSGTDPDLFYDDDSADPTTADLIQGINDIQPGESAIVLISGNASDITEFVIVWGPVIELSDVEIGFTDGAGLGGGGDAVNIWIGDPMNSAPVDTEAYPDTINDDGKSYDVELQAFSEIGNLNNAVATNALGGNGSDVPAIGSPGNGSVSPAGLYLRVTEIFNGQTGDDLTSDWFEIVNYGDEAWVSGVDPALFYDDESASAADADTIFGITDIQPGEAVIVLVTDAPADIAQFINVWSPVIDLDGIEVGYSDGAGLGGGGDTVNVWIGDPAMSAPFATAGYPNASSFDGQSFDVELQAFSVVGNANGAVETLVTAGSTGDVPNIGSPGNQGPAQTDPNAPIITGDVNNAVPQLNVPENGPAAVTADLNDPTDAASTIGIPFNLEDPDTPLSGLTVTAASDNQTVAPDANLSITGTGSTRTLTITPAAVGLANITVTVTDTDGNTDNYLINYAASDAILDPAITRFHVGAADGSTATAIDENYMWVADDEGQTIRMYDRSISSLPIKEINFDSDLGSSAEVDIEGSFRNGATIYWMGSHTNAERSVIFSTQESGTGADAILTFEGRYDDLLEDLGNWDATNGHGLGADYFGFATFLEIEGLAADPNNPDGALLGFRSTILDGNAVIVPVTNFQSIVSDNPMPNSATFGAPIEIDLGGHSIRSIDCNDDGCLIIGGPAGTLNLFRLFTWTGNAMDEPELRSVNLQPFENMSAFEGIVELPDTPFLGADGDDEEVQLIVDTGTFDYYNDGTEAKDLPYAEWKKFRSVRLVLDTVGVLPEANPGDIVITEIMQNPQAVNDSDGEWFEVYNASDVTIDLNNWTLSDLGADNEVIENGGPLEIAAGAYLVFGNNGDFATNGGVTIDYVYDNFNLSNGDDEIILTAADGIEIDRVEYDGSPNFPDPEGASMSLIVTNFDNNDGANWCVATTAYGDGDLGTPGMENDCPPPPAPDLQITEIWAGQDGVDLTADWFEITNFGDIAWVSGVDPDLFYDDESQEPADADLINGITDIQPGESVIVVVDNEAAVMTFQNVWSPDYNLTGIEVGWADGAGLGQGGDGVTLFLGGPDAATISDFESYPAPASGVSYDVVLGAFSVEGSGLVQLGTNIAVATTATGGTDGMEPAIGSPGNQGPIIDPEFDLIVTEIFAGQEGDDLTPDWFELNNQGTAPWQLSVDGELFYDDESAEPMDADTIIGLNAIQPGGTAIVLITDNPDDVQTFIDVWSPVIDLTGVEIGYTDGAGLGGGGDSVNVWLGDPMISSPITTAGYPDTAPFDGQSFDVDLNEFSVVGNANGAVQTIATAGPNGDVPNIGSPGNGLAVPPATGLTITEIFSGQIGDDLTADWFEIKNTGTDPWIAGVDPDLFYDDDSADPTVASLIEGLTELQPGATAIVLVTDNPMDVMTFTDVWSPVIDLSGVEVGFTDGGGLGGSGDAVNLWLGDPMLFNPIDVASYPDPAPFDGQSYDVELGEFSVVGNANGAVQTIATAGSTGDVPNIGSPGDGFAIPDSTGLTITEIWAGQEGTDLTVDWFEIVNKGDEAWVAGVDPDLFYDDESADPVDAVLIQGITDIQPDETVLVLLTDNFDDTTTFISVWGEVIDLTGIEIGIADGSGLGGGGDAVTLWLGEPSTFLPIDTASYPDTAPFDGQSYDVDLGAFSVVDNANGAQQTLMLGGDNADVPAIGSPGNQGPIVDVLEVNALDAIVKVFPNPSTGQFNVLVESSADLIAADVINMTGSILYQIGTPTSDSFEVDITNLPAGVYFLRVHTAEGMAVQRIMKR
jgi:hypothetical protein